MRRVPWWAVLSSLLAPIFLMGGWTVAAALQPPDFSATRDTISSLAALGAADRWVMTAGLAGVGVCHVITALGLHPAARVGRIVLAVGGVATILVAVFPVPEAGISRTHYAVATVGFAALALWPAFAWRRGPEASGDLQAGPAIVATVVLLGLLGWFGYEMLTNGPRVGLSERFAAGAQALWPMLVVLSTRTTSAPDPSPIDHDSKVDRDTV